MLTPNMQTIASKNIEYLVSQLLVEKYQYHIISKISYQFN